MREPLDGLKGPVGAVPGGARLLPCPVRSGGTGSGVAALHRARVDSQEGIESAESNDSCCKRKEADPTPRCLGSDIDEGDEHDSQQNADSPVDGSFIGFHECLLHIFGEKAVLPERERHCG